MLKVTNMNSLNHAVYEDWVLPELKRQNDLKRQVEIDEAKEELGFNRYITFPYTPREDRKIKTAAGVWGLISEIFNKISI